MLLAYVGLLLTWDCSLRSWRSGESPRGALFAKCAGELLAKLLVFLGEPPDAGVGGFEASQQGSVGSALTCGNRRSGAPCDVLPADARSPRAGPAGHRARTGTLRPRLRDSLERSANESVHISR